MSRNRDTSFSEGQAGGRLSPAVRSWLDNVVVPALVREYLAEVKGQEVACAEAEPVASSAVTEPATAEVVK